MRELTVKLGARSYPIFIGEGLFSSTELYEKMMGSSKLMIVTDTNIEKLYLADLLHSLEGFQVFIHVIPAGEVYKNLDTLNSVITAMLSNKISRSDCLIAFGGGVVGDLTGFAAACFQRGINFIQVPTTLLAQVDSSVGGKTAVNHKLGKNMIGAFHQPIGVISDVSVLANLPEREFSAGMAEVIKYGLIRDKDFFEWLESNIDKLLMKNSSELVYAIEKSCLNKAAVVSEDEKENGIRAILNLGHTFGHAIETGLNYQTWLHGEAVGMGMIMAAYMSLKMGWLSESDFERTITLIKRAGLPIKLVAECKNFNMRELMSIDKKVSDGNLKLILLKNIGSAVITSDFNEQVLNNTLEHFYGMT